MKLKTRPLKLSYEIYTHDYNNKLTTFEISQCLKIKKLFVKQDD